MKYSLIATGVLLIAAGFLLEMFQKEPQKLQGETGSGTVTGIKLPELNEVEAFEPVDSGMPDADGFTLSAPVVGQELWSYDGTTIAEMRVDYLYASVITRDGIYTKADAEEIVQALDLAVASNDFLYQFYMASIQSFGDNEEIQGNAERCRAAGLRLGILRDKWRKRLEEMK